jgi:hypothetical protein
MALTPRSVQIRQARHGARKQYLAAHSLLHAAFRRDYDKAVKAFGGSAPDPHDAAKVLAFEAMLAPARQRLVEGITAAQAARRTVTSQPRS